MSLRVTLVASVQLESFAPILALWLRRAGFCPAITVAPFGTLEQQIISPGSDLYESRPDIVVIIPLASALLARLEAGASRAELLAQAHASAEEFNRLAGIVRSRSNAEVVLAVAPSAAQRSLGNRDGTHPDGDLYRSRVLSLAFADLVQPSYVLFDLQAIAEEFGRSGFRDERYWYQAKQAFSANAFGTVAHALSRMIAGMRGLSRKVLVLDLDNTLWGGVIGDDGVNEIEIGADSGPDGEAFYDFQRYALKLKESGILLAICSKNDLEIARQPFATHPGMVLTLDDISVFRANWLPKPDNLRAIARELNVGLDSLVFVDDNPVERDLVRQSLPEIAVPEMPDDPAECVAALDQLLLFDRPPMTLEDGQRSAMIASERARRELVDATVDIESYLKSLGLEVECGGVDPTTEPRVTQLINKTNQFNLTGRKLSAAEVISFAETGFARWYRLRDRFGEYGIVSAVVGRIEADTLQIDNWVLSCRAFQRSLEAFVIRDLQALGAEAGCLNLKARHVDTGRNAYAANAMRELGLEKVDGGWLMKSLSEDMPRTFITLRV